MDGPGTADGFTALTNRGDLNEKGTTDDIDWAAMGKEEVNDNNNDAVELDICLIDIL